MSDALDAVEQIADEEERVKAKSRIMAEQVRRNPEWSAERDDLIRRFHEQEGLSYRKIADRLGVSLSIVQTVFRGYKGSGTARPRKDQAEE